MGAMPADVELATAASDLRIVLGQLIRRLRSDDTLPIAHLAVLSRLDRAGPLTASGLAAGERVRPQSMAQTLADLEHGGLVERRPDEVDRRQVLVELTPQGRELLSVERRRREDWLSRAISEQLTREEQALLVDAVALLRRLAEL
jgi:DNA-binding MarR family transcriptional regulator